MRPWVYNVPGTRCGNIANAGGSVESNPCWLFNKLFEAEELIEIAQMFWVIVLACVYSRSNSPFSSVAVPSSPPGYHRAIKGKGT